MAPEISPLEMELGNLGFPGSDGNAFPGTARAAAYSCSRKIPA
jgi:hypothetical protein